MVRFDELIKRDDNTGSNKVFVDNFVIIKFAIDIFASLYLKPEDEEFLVSFKLNNEFVQLPESTYENFDKVCPGKVKNFSYLMQFLNLKKDKSKLKMESYLQGEFNLV